MNTGAAASAAATAAGMVLTPSIRALLHPVSTPGAGHGSAELCLDTLRDVTAATDGPSAVTAACAYMDARKHVGVLLSDAAGTIIAVDSPGYLMHLWTTQQGPLTRECTDAKLLTCFRAGDMGLFAALCPEFAPIVNGYMALFDAAVDALRAEYARLQPLLLDSADRRAFAEAVLPLKLSKALFAWSALPQPAAPDAAQRALCSLTSKDLRVVLLSFAKDDDKGMVTARSVTEQ